MRRLPKLGLVLALALLLAAPAVIAQVTTYREFLLDLSKGPNSEFQRDLGNFGKSMLGTNQVQAIFQRTNGGFDYVWLRTVNGNIQAAGRGYLLFPAPTLRVQTTQQVIEAILGSTSRLDAVQAALRNGLIRVQGLTGVNNLAFRAFNLWSRWFTTGALPTVTPPPPSPPPRPPAARPKNCHETYLPGYRDYGLYPEVKKKWDEYTAQTQGSCVFWPPHRPAGGECVFAVEFVPPPGAGGGNQYLCWYGTK
jgi:hypothetical protein